jgi:hypothetical protein
MGKRPAKMESMQKNCEEQYIICLLFFSFTVPVKVNSEKSKLTVKVNLQKSMIKVNTNVAVLTWRLGLTWQNEKTARRVACMGGTVETSSGA